MFQDPIGNVPFGTTVSGRSGERLGRGGRRFSQTRKGRGGKHNLPTLVSGTGGLDRVGTKNGQLWRRAGKLQSDHTETRGTCCENSCSVHFGLGLGSGHRLCGRAAHANARAHVDSCTNANANAYAYSCTNRYAGAYAHAGSHRYPGPDAHTDTHAHASINPHPFGHAGWGCGATGWRRDYRASSG